MKYNVTQIPVVTYFCHHMATDSNKFRQLFRIVKSKFIFPSGEIYDGLQAVYDYGQWGSELKTSGITGGTA
jgi:glycyl-tRNA synthetase (class II)